MQNLRTDNEDLIYLTCPSGEVRFGVSIRGNAWMLIAGGISGSLIPGQLSLDEDNPARCFMPITGVPFWHEICFTMIKG
jgi:hypothetical protein